MILDGQGSIFDSDAEVLVNPVNTFGVMGAGLALQFREKYPSVYTAYNIACKQGRVRIGEMFVVEGTGGTGTVTIVHFPTKEHWQAPSRIEYVEKGLISLVDVVRGRSSVAIPALGCGLGGLPWPAVRALIENAFKNEDIQVTLFGPK